MSILDGIWVSYVEYNSCDNVECFQSKTKDFSGAKKFC